MDMEAKFNAHIETFWSGFRKDIFEWTIGPIRDSLPGFRVIRITPTRQGLPWVYLSMGAHRIDPHSSTHLEFFIIAPQEDPIHIESLAMVSHFHADPKHRLRIGSVMQIGRSWIEGSTCSHFLVSVPYPFGPELEYCETKKGLIRVLWLLPITAAEAEFAKIHGVEQLEKRFDQVAIDYDDPLRPSVI